MTRSQVTCYQELCFCLSYSWGKERALHVGLAAWKRERSSEARTGKQGPSRLPGGSGLLSRVLPVLRKVLRCDTTPGVSSMVTCARTVLRTFPKTCPPRVGIFVRNWIKHQTSFFSALFLDFGIPSRLSGTQKRKLGRRFFFVYPWFEMG